MCVVIVDRARRSRASIALTSRRGVARTLRRPTTTMRAMMRRSAFTPTTAGLKTQRKNTPFSRASVRVVRRRRRDATRRRWMCRCDRRAKDKDGADDAADDDDDAREDDDARD